MIKYITKMKRLIFTAAMVSCAIGTFISCKYENEYPCNESGIRFLKVVQTGTNNPVEGAEIILFKYLDDRALNTTPFKTLYTDHEGMIYWPCTDAVSEFCARREDYWDQCPGSFYLGFSEFTDDTHEMRPKAWIRFFVVDDPELNEAQYVQPAETYATLIGYSAATDSGYYAYLKVTGGIVNSLYVHRYNSNLERINIEEVPVQAGLFDTTDFVYRY